LTNDYDSADPQETAMTTVPPRSELSGTRRLPSNSKKAGITVALVGAVLGVCTACSTSPSAAASAPSATVTPSATPSSSAAGHGKAGAGGANARSGPAAGGSSGTVDSVSGSGFTLTTSAGQKVTVKEASSTTYEKGTSTASAGAVTTGESILVLGSTNSTTITATQVTVEAAGSEGSAASSAAGVVPFKQGAPSASKKVGQIPADYTEGSGTIVSGKTADKATEAALAAYPGGVVDRVVKLSNGEYEAHYIGVNWPHHIFVDQAYNVVGAF
jgi:hypothetical protein